MVDYCKSCYNCEFTSSQEGFYDYCRIEKQVVREGDAKTEFHNYCKGKKFLSMS